MMGSPCCAGYAMAVTICRGDAHRAGRGVRIGSSGWNRAAGRTTCPNPSCPRELTARIEAVLRRRGTIARAGTPWPDWRGDQLRAPTGLDLSAPHPGRDGEGGGDHSGEFSLLVRFCPAPAPALSRTPDRTRPRPGSETDSRSMDVQVRGVRACIEPGPQPSPPLPTDRLGYGYVFVPDGSPRSA